MVIQRAAVLGWAYGSCSKKLSGTRFVVEGVIFLFFLLVFGLQLCVILQFHCWCCVHLTFSMCVYCSCGETISSLLLAVLF